MSANTRTTRPTVQSLSARIDAQDVVLAQILSAVQALTPATVVAPAPAPQPPAAPAVPTTKVLSLSAFRALKRTKAGKAYAGVSHKDVLEGRAPMPAGFHAPTGARKAAIQAWKAAQA